MYAALPQESRVAGPVIEDIFFISGGLTHILFDTGVSYSFIVSDHVISLKLAAEVLKR